MPTIDLENIRQKMAALRWDFTLTIGGVAHRMRTPTPELIGAVGRLAAGKGGDVFALAAAVLDPPAAGLDLDQALALLVTYVQTYEAWGRMIFERIVKADPGAAAVLAVLAPAPAAKAATEQPTTGKVG